MFGVIEFDQVSPLEPKDPDPLKLTLGAGVIVFFDARINASSATDAPGEFKAISPEGIGEGFLRADLEFLPEPLEIPLLQLGNHPFLLLRCHLLEMLLQEVFGLFLCARGENGNRESAKSGERKISYELSSGVTFISHFSIPMAGVVEAQASGP